MTGFWILECIGCHSRFCSGLDFAVQCSKEIYLNITFILIFNRLNFILQEIYSIKLPGNPKLGEGKPENQNHAIIFTRGNAVQTIDMNQVYKCAHFLPFLFWVNYYNFSLKFEPFKVNTCSLDDKLTCNLPPVLCDACDILTSIFCKTAQVIAHFHTNSFSNVTLSLNIRSNISENCLVFVIYILSMNFCY